MELGIISWFSEEDFKRAKEKGMQFIELDINEHDQMFFDGFDTIKPLIEKYQMPVKALGRWGTYRLDENGIIEEELAIECKLIEACEKLDCGIYMAGCNYVESKSFYENCMLAADYLQKLVDHGKKHNVKIAVYNCRWNGNFVCEDKAWSVVLNKVKDLYIKYDTSHCIYAGGDYLKEARDWGDRFLHVHIKGALVIDGERYDDPPAGLDQTDWRSFMAILYAKGYDGGLSIEPHSANWNGELGERGVNYTIRFIRDLMI